MFRAVSTRRSTHVSGRQSRHRHRIRPRPRPRLRAGARAAGRRRRRQRRRRRGRGRRRRGDRGARRHAPSRSSPRSARPRPRRHSSPRRSSSFGRLDILVTNAGVLRDTVLWKMSDDDFDTRHQRAPARHVHLRARGGASTCGEAGDGGRIICIGSPTGQRGNFGQTNYAAAKAGIVGMVRTWALELKRAGITVNAVIPVAATAMTATVPYFAAAVEADGARRADARLLPPRPRLRHGGRRRRARRLPRLGRRGRRSPARRSASAATASSCGRHPEPVADRVPRRRLDRTTRSSTAFGRRRSAVPLQSVGETLPATARGASSRRRLTA